MKVVLAVSLFLLGGQQKPADRGRCASWLDTVPVRTVGRKLPPLKGGDWFTAIQHEYSLPIAFVEGSPEADTDRSFGGLRDQSLRSSLDSFVRFFPQYRWGCFGKESSMLVVYPGSDTFLTWQMPATEAPTSVDKAVSILLSQIEARSAKDGEQKVVLWLPAVYSGDRWMADERVQFNGGRVIDQLIELTGSRSDRTFSIFSGPQARYLRFFVLSKRDPVLPPLAAERSPKLKE